MLNSRSTRIALLGTDVFALTILVTVRISVVIAILVLVAVLISVVTVLPATLCLLLIRVSLRRPTLVVVRTIGALLASVSRDTPLRISTLPPIVCLCVAIPLIASTITPISVTSTNVTHHQTAHLKRIFHTDQVAIGRKAVVDITVVTIAEVVVFVLDGRRHLWQGSVADVVHLLGDLTRRTQGTVALFYAVANIVVVPASTTIVIRAPLALASVAIVVVLPTAVSALCIT